MANIIDDVFNFVNLLEDMSSNNYQWPSERSIANKAAGFLRWVS